MTSGSKNNFEEMKNLTVRVPLYEKSYNASRASRPEKNLPSLDELKKKCRGNLKEYAEELDRLAHMKSSIDTAYDAALKVVRSIKDGRSCPPEEAYIRVGEAVHDAWCVSGKKKYFDPERNGKQWQFLSSEAIGWDEFEKDMKYVSIALESLGYPPFKAIRDVVERHFEAKVISDPPTPEKEAARWAELSGFSWEIREDQPIGHESLEQSYADKMVGAPFAITCTDGKVYLKKEGTLNGGPVGTKAAEAALTMAAEHAKEIENKEK